VSCQLSASSGQPKAGGAALSRPTVLK